MNETNQPFEIGVTDLTNLGGFVKKEFARLQPGDNLYRVLPPIRSLAKKNQFSQFHAFHGGLKDSAGHFVMFQCPEVTDRKAKVITTHCPQCDIVRENRAKYDAAKKAKEAGQVNASDEQLKKFWDESIFHYQVQKLFFLNAINASGDIVILGIPYNSHKFLVNLLNDLKPQGVDPTGMHGVFLNFKKQQAFKGDRDTKYPVEIAYEGGFATPRPRLHELTQEIINAMAGKSADLPRLYPSVTPEDLAAILSASGDAKTALVDKVFSRGQNSQKKSAPTGTGVIPGTVPTVSASVTSGAGVQSAITGSQLAALTPTLTPVVPAVAQVVIQATAPTSPITLPAGFELGQTKVGSEGMTKLNNDDFFKMFGPK